MAGTTGVGRKALTAMRIQAPARNRKLYFDGVSHARSARAAGSEEPVLIARILRLALLAGALAVLGLAAVLAKATPIGWPWALVVALALVPAGFALVLGAEFIAAALLGDRHWSGILPAWLGEVRASMRTFLFALPLHGGRAPRSAAGERLPVVLVHGYFCNGAVWRPLARHLAAAGHPLAAVDLERPFGPIDAHSATIARAVAQVGGGRPVVLVGHSMGGLAIRAYLRESGAAGIAGVVTLGSPHRGTRAAALGRSPAARQMRRGSEWLEALATHEARRAQGAGERRHPPVCVVLTRNDNIVYPQAEQVLPGARVLRLHGVGHLDLVYRPAVWRLVEAEIRRFES